jgi:hypothetical protein
VIPLDNLLNVDAVPLDADLIRANQIKVVFQLHALTCLICAPAPYERRFLLSLL